MLQKNEEQLSKKKKKKKKKFEQKIAGEKMQQHE
jgi:hypothetical protein